MNISRKYNHIIPTKVKYAVAFIVFVVSIGFIGENSIIERWKRKQEIATLKEKIQIQKKRFREDKLTLEKLRKDPDEIIRIAREKYYMKTDQEDIFIIEDKDN